MLDFQFCYIASGQIFMVLIFTISRLVAWETYDLHPYKQIFIVTKYIKLKFHFSTFCGQHFKRIPIFRQTNIC